MTDIRGLNVEVVDNADLSRYELLLDGNRIGVANYTVRDGVVIMPHTEVDFRHGGQGYGQELVRRALEDIDARGLKVAPMCSFVADFIRRNPEYADLVATRPH